MKSDAARKEPVAARAAIVGLLDELQETERVRERVQTRLDALESELLARDGVLPDAFSRLTKDVDDLIELLASIASGVEALEPKERDWRVLLPVEDGIVYANGLDDIVRMPFDIAAMFAGGRVPSGRVEDQGRSIAFHLMDGRVVAYPKSLVAAVVGDRHIVERGSARNRDAEHEGGGGAQ